MSLGQRSEDLVTEGIMSKRTVGGEDFGVGVFVWCGWFVNGSGQLGEMGVYSRDFTFRGSCTDLK